MNNNVKYVDIWFWILRSETVDPKKDDTFDPGIGEEKKPKIKLQNTFK